MDKLQELTERLYNEGLSKGKEEAKAIVAEAEATAASIIAEAKKEAERIKADAKKQADDFIVKTNGDVKMASRQSIQAVRSDIENLVVSKMVDKPVETALADGAFVKEIIKAVAERFSTEESQDLSVILPESMRDSLGDFVSNELSLLLGKGVEASFSKKIAGGFKIAPKDGSYFISLTDETFKDLIGAYLRPATKQLLFGDE